jgi:hypothetical protein
LTPSVPTRAVSGAALANRRAQRSAMLPSRPARLRAQAYAKGALSRFQAVPGIGDTVVMRASRRVEHVASIRLSTIIQAAIVLGGVIAAGLLVAAHPLAGVALVVAVLVLAVLLIGRAPVTEREPREHDDEPAP